MAEIVTEAVAGPCRRQKVLLSPSVAAKIGLLLHSGRRVVVEVPCSSIWSCCDPETADGASVSLLSGAACGSDEGRSCVSCLPPKGGRCWRAGCGPIPCSVQVFLPLSARRVVEYCVHCCAALVLHLQLCQDGQLPWGECGKLAWVYSTGSLGIVAGGCVVGGCGIVGTIAGAELACCCILWMACSVGM